MVRKGNESLLQSHPFLNHILIWDKKSSKYKNLFKLLKQIRNEKYDLVINLQRFGASGLLTVLSGANEKRGFSKNPFSAFFDRKFPHFIGSKEDKVYPHEIERNNALIEDITDSIAAKPKLYPSEADYQTILEYKGDPYYCMAPASVWFTKQLPITKWLELIKRIPIERKIYFLGGKGDYELCQEIKNGSQSERVINLAGKFSFLETAALMKDANMNYTNDSAPLHIASAMNAPISAIFCSTIPQFGFGPLSDKSYIIEIQESLYCRPCGLHGYKKCPEGHFKCAYDIRFE